MLAIIKAYKELPNTFTIFHLQEILLVLLNQTLKLWSLDMIPLYFAVKCTLTQFNYSDAYKNKCCRKVTSYFGRAKSRKSFLPKNKYLTTKLDIEKIYQCSNFHLVINPI